MHLCIFHCYPCSPFISIGAVFFFFYETEALPTSLTQFLKLSTLCVQTFLVGVVGFEIFAIPYSGSWNLHLPHRRCIVISKSYKRWKKGIVCLKCQRGTFPNNKSTLRYCQLQILRLSTQACIIYFFLLFQRSSHCRGFDIFKWNFMTMIFCTFFFVNSFRWMYELCSKSYQVNILN